MRPLICSQKEREKDIMPAKILRHWTLHLQECKWSTLIASTQKERWFSSVQVCLTSPNFQSKELVCIFLFASYCFDHFSSNLKKVEDKLNENAESSFNLLYSLKAVLFIVWSSSQISFNKAFQRRKTMLL